MELRICSISKNSLKFSGIVKTTACQCSICFSRWKTDALPGCKDATFGSVLSTRHAYVRLPSIATCKAMGWPICSHSLLKSIIWPPLREATDPEASMPSWYTQAENRGIGCTSRRLLRTKHLNEATTLHQCPVVGQWVLTHGWVRCSPRPFCKPHFSQNLCKYRGIDGATLVTSLNHQALAVPNVSGFGGVKTSSSPRARFAWVSCMATKKAQKGIQNAFFSLHIPRTQMTPSKNRSHLGFLGMQILYIYRYKYIYTWFCICVSHVPILLWKSLAVSG